MTRLSPLLSSVPVRRLLLQLGQSVPVDTWRGPSSGSPGDYTVLSPHGAHLMDVNVPRAEHENPLWMCLATEERVVFITLTLIPIWSSPACLKVC